jgi:hypothetical protein
VQEKKNSEGSPPFGGWGAGKEDGRKKTKDKSKKTKGAVGSWQLAEGKNEMKILCK